jgi:hypothetical protein
MEAQVLIRIKNDNSRTIPHKTLEWIARNRNASAKLRNAAAQHQISQLGNFNNWVEWQWPPGIAESHCKKLLSLSLSRKIPEESNHAATQKLAESISLCPPHYLSNTWLMKMHHAPLPADEAPVAAEVLVAAGNKLAIQLDAKSLYRLRCSRSIVPRIKVAVNPLIEQELARKISIPNARFSRRWLKKVATCERMPFQDSRPRIAAGRRLVDDAGSRRELNAILRMDVPDAVREYANAKLRSLDLQAGSGFQKPSGHFGRRANPSAPNGHGKPRAKRIRK